MVCLLLQPVHAQQPTFRSNIDLASVDVRVVDGQGKPVTDLTADSFELFENGVRQEIRQFARRSTTISPEAPRTFCFLLGRGHLNAPVKALDALIAFVRSGLRPPDRVCLIAYERATVPTTNHEAVAVLLEKYRASHDSIEATLANDVRFASPMFALSERTKSGIDEIFQDSAVSVHELPDAAGGKMLGFIDFESLNRAIDYLKQLNSEKNLVFITADGMTGAPTAAGVARACASSRITLSLIQTGGLAEARRASVSVSGRSTFDNPRDHFVSVAPAYVGDTGGFAAMVQDPTKALERFEQSTRVEYLLGYSPQGPPAVGEFRKIRVEVNRSHVSVLYRHGYEPGTPAATLPIDVRSAFTERRLLYAAAADYRFEAIPIKIEVLHMVAADRMRLSLDINPFRVMFARHGDDYTATIDLAVFAGDTNGTMLARKNDRIELRVGALEFERLKKEHIHHAVDVDLQGKPAQVKVVAFDYDSDRLGSVTARVQ